jgi:AcrR family transcriptional regulator
MSGVEQEAVRAHVARITASDLFAGAGRLCRFLLFTVESKLDGRESDVKEYVLGREVFDRGNDYDTRLDPIVRVEARRLRARLAEYYSGPGRDEPMRLEYPKGSYVPVFSSVATTHARAFRPSWVQAVLAALALVLILAAGGAYWLMRAQPLALIAPIPGRWIEPNDGTLDAADAALAEGVDAQLANRAVGVVAWPELLRRNDIHGTPLRDVASEVGATQLLVVMVRDVAGGKRVNVFLIDEPAGRKRLALTYDNPPLATEAEQRSLATRIANDLLAHVP